MKPQKLALISCFKWSYLSIAVQGLLKLLALVVLARLLTPHDFGLVTLALIYTSFIERLAQSGIGPTVVQLRIASTELITTARFLSVSLGIVSTGLVILGAAPLAYYLDEPQLALILKVMSIGCAIEGLAAIPEALLQRQLKFREVMLADNLAYLISMLGVCVVLALSGCGVWSLVIAHIVLKIVRFLVLTATAPRIVRGRISSASALEISRLAFGFSLARLLNLLSLQGDNFVVGRLLGTEALGIYNRAYQLMTLPAMYIGQVYERVMFPALAREQDDIKRVRENFLVALEVVTLTALPAGVAIYILSGEIALGGFGERWVGVAPILSILSFGVFFRTAYKCSDTTVRALGAVYHYAARQGLYACLVIGGAFLGARLGGISGVAYGVVVAVGINYLSMTRLCIKLSGVSLKKVLRAHLSGLWVSGLSFLVLERGIDYIRLSVGRSGAGDALLVLFYGGVLAAIVWGVSVLFLSCFIPFGVLPVVRRYLVSRKASALG